MHLWQETVCAWEQLGYVQFLFFFSNDILYFCRLLKDQILWILMKETNGISLIYIYIYPYSDSLMFSALFYFICLKYNRLLLRKSHAVISPHTMREPRSQRSLAWVICSPLGPPHSLVPWQDQASKLLSENQEASII